MSQRLAVVALWGTLLAWGPCVAHHEQAERHKDQGNAGDHASRQGEVVPQAGTSAAGVHSKHDETEAEASKKESDDKLTATWKRPEWVSVYVAAISALITGFTLFTLWRQVNVMEDQTAIAKAAAHAAARSVQAFINKERDRLMVQPEVTEKFIARFHAVNHGNSPARMTYGFVRCELLDPTKERFPSIPDYTCGDKPSDFAQDDWVLPGQSTLIGSEDAWFVDRANNKDTFQDVVDGRLVLWFYGVGRYWDSVSENEQELRFCYRCEPSPDGKHRLYERGPEAYRRET